MNERNPLFAPFDHAALTECLHALADEYSAFEFSYLGSSILDRSIPLLRFGSGARRVLYVGAHHGMEWITSLVLYQFAKELCEAISIGTRIGRIYPDFLLENYTLYILPMLNPDGVEYQIHGVSEENPLYDRLLEMNGGDTDFSHWQANARGVDLNHNYDAGFEAYRELAVAEGIGKGAPTRYAGEFAESEPEVAALCNFIRYHESWHGVMTLHTQGEEIFAPPCSRRPQAAVTARRLQELTGYRLARAEGLAAYGGLSDWCAGALSIPSFTMECGRGKNPLPIAHFAQIYRGMRQALFYFPSLL